MALGQRLCAEHVRAEAKGKKIGLPFLVQRDEVVIGDIWVAMGIEELNDYDRYRTNCC